MGEDDSRKIQKDLLERKYPKVKALLAEGEILLAVSERKPLRITGLFCIIIGMFLAVQVSVHFLSPYPQWSAAALAASAACVWWGVWLAFLCGGECVFVTDCRIAHRRVDFAGRLAESPFSISLEDIAAVRLFRNTLIFGGRNNRCGDILIKKRGGGSYLVPSMKNGVGLSEILMAEVSVNNNNKKQKF